MKRNKLFFINIFFIFSTVCCLSQETIIDLDYNPVIKNYLRSHPETMIKRSNARADTLQLPFFDDFSGTQVFPDTGLWEDNYAFINSTYPDNPLSIGVATLDAIDNYGEIYEDAGSQPFIADMLTSLPVDLDYPADSAVFFSFVYQPEGKGYPPEAQDSLLLEFRTPDTTWHTVWSAEGTDNHDFKTVILPVDDTIYLKKGFQFRFSNYASLSTGYEPSWGSNNDHWNIDYVYLDTHRDTGDTIIRDMAFTYPLQSLLDTLEAMPWNHYLNAGEDLTENSVTLYFRNNHDSMIHYNPVLEIYDIMESSLVWDHLGSGVDSWGLEDLDYTFDMSSYNYSSDSQDSALFEVKGYIDPDDNYYTNDTIVYYQKFYNYYAYDDGTAEKGYGLTGAGTQYAMVAYRFHSYMEDTLQAIDMYFNQTHNDASSQYFFLMVWDDDNGVPGDTLYFEMGNKPPAVSDSLNKFTRYEIDTTVIVSGDFYVGWGKTTTDMLNVGFDKNNNVQNRIFYNIYGTWQNTSSEGALMVRPVLGKPLPVSVPEYTVDRRIMAYPNPAHSRLFINYPANINDKDITVGLFNIYGRVIYSSDKPETTIDISNLPGGIYILKVSDLKNYIATEKIIITD